LSCIVLAGGKSKRLGRNKVVETIGQLTLLERVISRLISFQTEIIIVKAEDSTLPRLTQFRQLNVVRDIYSGKGSLGGVYTGLAVSRSHYNLVVAGDMPFLSLPLLKFMVSVSEGYDAVVPKVSPTIFEPLHAIYSKNCIGPLERLILANDFVILDLFPMVNVRYIEALEIDKYDSRHLSFFNVNTEADLKTGRELERKGDV